MSNVAVMELHHQRAAKQAREALGDLHYETAHDRGGALDLAAVVAWAADDRGTVPWPGDVGLPRDGDGVAAGIGAGAGLGLGAAPARRGTRGSAQTATGARPGRPRPSRPRL